MKITSTQVRQLVDNIENGKPELADQYLKEWFPKAFKIELGLNKWYVSASFLIMYKGDERCVSISKTTGQYKDNDPHTIRMHETCEYKEATHQEVETALIAEAKNRPIISGVVVKTTKGTIKPISGKIVLDREGDLISLGDEDGLRACLFSEGVFATIIETITKAEAEKTLGKKIV